MPHDRTTRPGLMIATGAVALLTACAGSPPPAPAAAPASASTAADPGSTSPPSAAPAAPPSTPPARPRTIEPTYAPVIDPARFSTVIDNPFFPLVPGTRLIYQGTTVNGKERNVVEVTRETKVVMGVETRVVHDVVEVGGEPEEETFDWYAQDAEGNVWYFGEDTREVGGPTVDTSGSFTAGVDGALPGIIMPGNPMVGDHYRQEYSRGVAEDTGKVLSVTGRETAPLGGARTDLLVTEDANPLDPSGGVENKYFARGVGNVVAVQITGPAERVELVAVERF